MQAVDHFYDVFVKTYLNLLVNTFSKYNKATPLLDSVKIISIRALHLASSNEFRATQINRKIKKKYVV